MIATHNIKVNGRWIHAGEEYEPEQEVTPKKAEKAVKPAKQEAEVAEAKAEEPEAPKAEQKTETKVKSTTRRKVSK